MPTLIPRPVFICSARVVSDAIELARCFAQQGEQGMEQVMQVYQQARALEVLRILMSPESYRLPVPDVVKARSHGD